jgi:two-component system nitrate/nitrite response regulator NarL
VKVRGVIVSSSELGELSIMLQRRSVRVVLGDTSRMHCDLMSQEFKRRNCGIQVVASAVDTTELLETVSSTNPDVVVCHVDLRDSHDAGLRATRQLRMRQPDLRIVLLLRSNHREQIVRAFRHGAHGVFNSDESIQELCKCIENVMRGEIWASSKELGYLLEALSETEPANENVSRAGNRLTRREEEIASLVASGLTNREIASRLALSEHTVRNYLFRIFEKLGISSRVELVLRTVEQSQFSAARESLTP